MRHLNTATIPVEVGKLGRIKNAYTQTKKISGIHLDLKHKRSCK